jgi:hypothetical protein
MKIKLKYKRDQETKKLHGSLDKFTFRTIIYLLAHNRQVINF